MCIPPSSFLEIGVLAIVRLTDFLSGVEMVVDGLSAAVFVVLRTGVAAGLIAFGTCFLGVVVVLGRTTFVGVGQSSLESSFGGAFGTAFFFASPCS